MHYFLGSRFQSCTFQSREGQYGHCASEKATTFGHSHSLLQSQAILSLCVVFREAINHVISGSQDLNMGRRLIVTVASIVDASRPAFRGSCYPRRVEAEAVSVCQGVAQDALLFNCFSASAVVTFSRWQPLVIDSRILQRKSLSFAQAQLRNHHLQ